MRRRVKYSSCEKIDIGCRNKIKPGHIGIDINDYGQEILWDATHGLPFQDNTVSRISSSHFFEHVKDEQLEELFFEMYRIAKPNAEIDITVPHATSVESRYVCHYSLWDEQKVKGIVRGLGSEFNFNIINMSRNGIEFIFKLKVIKQ